MSSEPPSRRSWEELLSDKDVVVLTKATFFRTVNLLFRFAEDPERCTWEFFHYRGYEYILGTWCATFDIEGFAISCGAQHPFIYRLKRGMHYALPDYVLLSHHRDANGEQEDHIVLVVEIKALGKVDPDTQAGRETAENIFHKTWTQRENQARLGFRSNSSQQTVNIVMASGPWFALYIYERSQLMGDGTVNEGRSLRDSPPTKRRRKVENIGFVERDDMTVLQTAGVDSLDGGKRKREAEAKASPDTAPVVNHVFQLGPSGERDALNPWFLQMLGQVKDNLERFRGEFKTQNSWFDWPTDVMPTGDGHAEGFVLPTTGAAVPDVDTMDVGHILRLDDDPAIVGGSVPSTPGNGRGTLNMLELNALLSPTMHRTYRAFRGDSDVPSTHSHSSIRRFPPRHQEKQSADSASGTDDDSTPKGPHGRQSQGIFDIRRRDRELSPSDAYLERRQHGPGPLHPPQFYPAPPDSSPLHFTPQKQLFLPSTVDGSDLESLTGYYSPGPEGIPRPASAPPASSSPASYTLHGPTESRSNQPRLGYRVQQDHVGRSTTLVRPTPLPHAAGPSRPAPPSRGVQYVLPPPFRGGAPSRRMTQRMGNPAITTEVRVTATQDEWRLAPPIDDELLLIAMRASREGVTDYEQAYRNAGMAEDLARYARRRYDDVHRIKDTGTGSKSTLAALAIPPPHPQRRLATDTSSSGAGPSQPPCSGVATGPPPTDGGAVARGGRPPRTSAARTVLGHNESGSESLNDCPDEAPGPTALGSTSNAQMNRLAEGIENLDVTNVAGNVGSLGWGLNPLWDLDSLYSFTEVAIRNRWQVFHDLRMDEKKTERAYRRKVFTLGGDSRGRLWECLHELLASEGAKDVHIDQVMQALVEVEKRRRATTGSDAHSLSGLSESNRGRGDPHTQQTDPGLALPGHNFEPGPSSTNTSRKGKEKQG